MSERTADSPRFHCPACGASFEVASWYSSRIYCSRKCRALLPAASPTHLRCGYCHGVGWVTASAPEGEPISVDCEHCSGTGLGQPVPSDTGLWSGADPRIVTLRRERDALQGALRFACLDLAKGDDDGAELRVRLYLSRAEAEA